MAALTYMDLVDHAVEYIGGDVDVKNATVARRAVQAAYDEAVQRHDWSFLRSYRRIPTVAQYGTGTVAYNPTTRELTLTGGTWPDWSQFGQVRIADITYAVASRTSGTVIVIDPTTPMPSDLASGSSFSLVRDVYPLDPDVLRIDAITAGEFGIDMGLVGPNDMPGLRRRNAGPGRPRGYFVGGYLGGLGLYVWPAPDIVYQLDFMVKRRPTPLTVERRNKGTVATGTSSAVVTGTGTDFDARLVGAVIRISDQNKLDVTGPTGEMPCVIEGVVLSVQSATQLTLTANAGQTLASVKYVCSSPVDIDQAAIGRYLLREIDRQVRLILRMELTKLEQAEYTAAKTEAREADNRYTGPMVASIGGRMRGRRLVDYPNGSEFREV